MIHPTDIMADKKVIEAVILVVVVIIVAVAAVVLLNDNDDDNDGDENVDNYALYLTPDSGKATLSSVDTKLLVFGNANNDVYLNEEDVKFIQDIVDGKATWNSSKNPLADTNADGSITADDVSLLKRFIAGEESSMFYVNSHLSTTKVKWPMTGKIAIETDNDRNILKIAGMEDRIVYTATTYPYNYESVVASGATITLGQGPYMYDDTFLSAVSAGYSSFPIDPIQLHEARSMNGVEGMAVTVTIGALLNAYGHGTYDKYLEYVQDVQDIVSKAISSIKGNSTPTFEILVTHACNSPSDIGMDTKTNAEQNYLDVGAAETLKLSCAYPVSKVGEDGYITGLTIEDVLQYAPDVLFVEYTNGGDLSAYKTKVAEVAGWFQSAGYKGKIIAVNFDVFGTASNASVLPLIASFVYGNDVYNEDDGWNQVIYYYNTFLDGNYTVDSIKDSIYTSYIIQ